MAYELPPPPSNAQAGSFAWYDWYTKLRDYVLNISSATPHNSLANIQGGTSGEYYHLTNTQYGKITYLANVTSDIQTQLNTKAPLISPAFTTSVGFNGTSPITKPTVSGSRGGNAALASLLTALANYGLITDSTSA